MALVTAPKAPGKGDVRWNENARCQSTDPDSIGANADDEGQQRRRRPDDHRDAPGPDDAQQVDRHKEQDDGAGQC